MPEAITMEATKLNRVTGSILVIGRFIFLLAIISLVIKTIMCAFFIGSQLGAQFKMEIPVIPWLPNIPWIAYLLGAIWIVCGACLLGLCECIEACF